LLPEHVQAFAGEKNLETALLLDRCALLNHVPPIQGDNAVHMRLERRCNDRRIFEGCVGLGLHLEHFRLGRLHYCKGDGVSEEIEEGEGRWPFGGEIPPGFLQDQLADDCPHFVAQHRTDNFP
jgi:hypothetical protein